MQTDAPAAYQQAPEPPAIFPFEGDANPDVGVTIEIVASEAAPQDVIVPPDVEVETLPAEALEDDAAARIAAEANATAAALENLKRLLMHRLPEPYIAGASNRQEAGPELTEPPPIPAYRPAVQLPVTPPPMIAAPVAATALSYFEEDDAPPRRWLSVGSFFAGLALTVVFGTVLAKHAMFAGSGLVAVMFALNIISLIRFLWRPANPVALLVSKLAVQFSTILSLSVAMLGLILALGGFNIVRAVNPMSMLVAIGLMALWSVGCAILAHRDWNAIAPSSVDRGFGEA